jgi:xylan 1,4-beta-xylosidase
VETPDGQGFHTFLMGRPIPGPDGTGRFCPLGRETGIARVVWRDGWLWLEGGGQLPPVTLPGLADVDPAPAVASETDFTAGLPDDFQWLRTPYPERLFRTGPGGLVLIGRESLGSWFEQALVARRQEHHAYAAETVLADFAPDTYQQAAGLTTYYNRHKFHAAMVTQEPGVGRALTILSCPGDWPDGGLSHPVAPVPVADGPVHLRVTVDHAHQQFWWRQDGGDWQPLGPALDASVISDEGGRGEHGSFTGAFVGLVAFDTSGRGREARFRQFRYAPG